ncbi:MAG: thioesterase [Hydrogenophaga sp.]|uniref:thioesterase II family protein n=1 Tax=Hydrogenophaga sp. TaxID=1904254 RepID=UPI001D7413BE|nr:thioesterase domain-containing protein [Hydrogenophaga sp.]MBX3611467.1 thioesterase [Hydrogenophaga sp.]
MSNSWLLRFVPRHSPRMRLFCFTHAGASAGVFRPWCQDLPESIELVAIQLPGRANRLNEAPLRRMADLVAGVVQSLGGQLGLPYAFFGHSMGAVLASEVARRLRDMGERAPVHLFVSGRRPPHWPNPDPLLHVLDDAGFVSEVQRRYGGIPPEVAVHEDLMALLLPALRADIEALETHLPPLGREPLACPVTVYGGADDPLTPLDHLHAWREDAGGSFRVRVWPGDHFYLQAQRSPLLADLADSLLPTLVGTAREAVG